MTALIVPMNVCALVVGNDDAAKTSDFARLTHAFEQLLDDGPYLAESISPGAFDTLAGEALPSGVHLHWALPAPLAHGATADDPKAAGALTFKTPPNRWLVTRLALVAAKLVATAWVVESDVLWDPDATPDASDPNSRSRHVPVEPQGSEIVQRLGRVTPLGSRPAVASAGTAAHTAMGYGVPSYSAAYPHAPNVFGMWDGAQDAAPARTATYLVTGWYSDPSLDPLGGWTGADGTRSLDALAKATGWVLPHDTTAPDLDDLRMICSGAVTGVPVDLDASHLGDRPDSSIEIAVGHTGVEALSALLAARDGGTDAVNLELALSLLQEGLLPKLREPGGLTFCDDRLHSKRFLALPGGTQWTLERSTPASTDAAVAAPDLAAAAASAGVPLPAALAAKLDELNDLQRAADAAERDADAACGQLFADWCKYLETQYGQPGPDAPAADDAHAFVERSASAAKTARATADQATATAQGKAGDLTAAAAPDFVPSSTAAARFWRPAEPVVLISGADVTRPDRYGRDGQVELPFALGVRTSEQLVGALELQPGGARIGAADVPSLDLGAPFPDELAALVAETALLTPDAVTALPGDATAITAAQDSARSSGPPALAFASWSQPWIPLLLSWELEFTPDQDSWSPAALLGYTSGALDPQGRRVPEVTREIVAPSAPAGRPHLYSGTALLATSATVPLASQIDEYLAAYGDDPEAQELQAVRADVGAGFLAQSLSGLGDAFLMRHQGLHLPVHDPNAIGDQVGFTQDVSDAVGQANDLAAMPMNPFSPLRGGRAKITRLRIVDAFGQVRSLVNPDIIRAAAAKPPGSSQPSEIWMPPRLQQGARLNFRWISAADDRLESSHPASSPVCGWLLYNRVDDSLAVYDADGHALGSLHRIAPVWRDAPGTTAPLAHGVNAHLAALAASVTGRTGAPAFLADLFDAIDATLTNVATGTAIGAGTTAALVARPLALVRAQLDAELFGPAALSQSWPEFNAAATGNKPRTDAGIAALELPVELGDLSASDDGLIGYFADDAYDTFFAPAAEDHGNGVRPAGRGDLTVRADRAAAPRTVTMIVDPAAGVYAATGVLPRKRISIPPEMYATALRNLVVTFEVMPALASRRPLPDGDRVGIPVPSEPGFDWTWLTLAGGPDTVDTALVEPPAAALDGPPRVLADGWLALAPSKPKGQP